MTNIKNTKDEVVAYLKKKLDFPIRIYNKIMLDEIFKESAALTFMTVLGFIPFLLLVLFVIPEIPGFDFKKHVNELFLTVLLPDSVETGTAYLSQILDQKIPSNIFNVALLALTSFALFRFINSTFDKILSVTEEESKNIFVKFSKFIMMIFFGFIFTLIILSSTSVTLLSQVLNLPIISNLSYILIPFLMFASVNAFMYFFATSVHFRIKSLLIGSVIAAAIWSVAKLGFDFYITNLTNMEVVYGVIATLPIFLFWIYLNWLIILFGVELISFLEKKGR